MPESEKYWLDRVVEFVTVVHQQRTRKAGKVTVGRLNSDITSPLWRYGERQVLGFVNRHLDRLALANTGRHGGLEVLVVSCADSKVALACTVYPTVESMHA